MKKDTNTSEKSKILMRTYITSILSLMLCVTMLLGTTYAWFTSEVTTAGNEIYVGTLKVDLTDDKGNSLDGATGLFGSKTDAVAGVKWEPGATQIETVRVVNKGDLAFDYALYLSTVGSDVGALPLVGQYIDVYITTHNAPAANAQDLKNNWIRVGTLAEVAKNGYMLANGSCTTPASVEKPVVLDEIKIALHMPAEVSNTDIMGKTVKNLGVRLMATQKVYESDDFNNKYDEAAGVDVMAANYTELAAAVNGGQSVRLTANIEVPVDTTLTVPTGKDVVIDMNGFDITGTSSVSSSNREMILVKGNLTVKGVKTETATVAEGETVDPYKSVISYKHTGDPMGWNAMSTVFTVTSDGVLNLVDVKVLNEGGTEMSFVAHLANYGDASLYMDGAHLEAPYCAIRVFNAGPGMNNVIAKDTTIKSENRALWVHMYTEADFKTDYDAAAIEKRLNISILDATNTVSGQMLYGFTNGEFRVRNAAELDAALAKAESWADETVTITLLDDISFRDKTITIEKADLILNLNGHKLEGTYTAEKASAVIHNKSKLTVEDATGKGAIEMKSAVVSADNGYATNTVMNDGILVVNGGNIINNLNGASYAIDNNSGATATINGGYIYNSHANGTAIRAYSHSATAVSKVEINGGTIKGGYGVRLHNLSTSVASAIELTVNGGTLIGTDETYHMALYSLCNDGANVKVTLNGGTYEGDVAFGGGSKAAPETVTINKKACTFKGEVFSYNTNVTNADNLLK